MNKNISLLFTVVLVFGLLAGCSGIVYDKSDGDLSIVSQIEKQDTLNAFNEINLDVHYTDVTVKAGEKYGLEYISKEGYDYNVKDGALQVSTKDAGIKAYNFYAGGNDTLTITLPEGVPLNNIKIQSQGDVLLNGISIDNLDMTGSYNSVKLNEVSTKNAVFHMNNTNISVSDSTINDCFVENRYGSYICNDVVFEGLQADIQNCEVKIVGDLNGITKIEGSYSDVDITANAQRSAYSYLLQSSHGDIIMNGEKTSGSIENRNNTDNTLEINISTGNIIINFA